MFYLESKLLITCENVLRLEPTKSPFDLEVRLAVAKRENRLMDDLVTGSWTVWSAAVTRGSLETEVCVQN